MKTEFAAALTAVLANGPPLLRVPRFGPGPKNLMRGYGRYDGAALRAIRAERGVGRPVAMRCGCAAIMGHEPSCPDSGVTVKIVPLFDQIKELMASGLSQRKTAAALGIHLSKLQRTLAKGQPAVA